MSVIRLRPWLALAALGTAFSAWGCSTTNNIVQSNCGPGTELDGSICVPVTAADSDAASGATDATSSATSDAVSAGDAHEAGIAMSDAGSMGDALAADAWCPPVDGGTYDQWAPPGDYSCGPGPYPTQINECVGGKWVPAYVCKCNPVDAGVANVACNDMGGVGARCILPALPDYPCAVCAEGHGCNLVGGP